MAPSPAGTERLVSLDVFRGMTIAGMILVNDAGDWNKTYVPLLHAEWNGWTPLRRHEASLHLLDSKRSRQMRPVSRIV